MPRVRDNNLNLWVRDTKRPWLSNRLIHCQSDWAAPQKYRMDAMTMYQARITFGTDRGLKLGRDGLYDLAEGYLIDLRKNGQTW